MCHIQAGVDCPEVDHADGGNCIVVDIEYFNGCCIGMNQEQTWPDEALNFDFLSLVLCCTNRAEWN